VTKPTGSAADAAQSVNVDARGGAPSACLTRLSKNISQLLPNVALKLQICNIGGIAGQEEGQGRLNLDRTKLQKSAVINPGVCNLGAGF
jgi:hypothetical protein